jgi:hypothetical protein
VIAPQWTRRLVGGVALLGVLAIAHAGARSGLVRCGDEEVAVFSDTVSKDRRFALGWTIRSRHKPAPAPWALYDPDDAALHARMGLLVDEEDQPRQGEHTPVQGLVDLRAHRFVPIASEEPAFAGRVRNSLDVRWFAPHGATLRRRDQQPRWQQRAVHGRSRVHRRDR